jgi:hypothetical protein
MVVNMKDNGGMGSSMGKAYTLVKLERERKVPGRMEKRSNGIAITLMLKL